MFRGRVEAIYIGERKHADLERVHEVEAIPGSGLHGDRYCRQQGTFSKPGSPDREVTLIELEAIEAAAREQGIHLQPHQPRRNLLTRDVPLNHLVGKEFQVGNVVLRGIRLCEPCDHLEKLTSVGVKDAFHHRAGLRAQILKGGVLREGDPIALVGDGAGSLSAEQR
jgi:MOSC domain-containing protein YiiM